MGFFNFFSKTLKPKEEVKTKEGGLEVKKASTEAPVKESAPKTPKVSKPAEKKPKKKKEVKNKEVKEALKEKIKEKPNSIKSRIAGIFTKKKLDDEALEELEDLLLINDIGVESANEIIENLRKEKFSKTVDDQEIKEFLANHITKILEPCQKPLEFKSDKKPQVIIFNGVNGSGKTTTIGKIAKKLASQNSKVVIAACDTFRAAAVEQLEVWADRAHCEIISSDKEGGDPASVAYKAFEKAKKDGADFLLIDTAGRLQNKQHLMEELRKINKVLRKIDNSDETFENILVLDATTGQNAKSQLEAFDEITNITGLIITKLDGSSKGGILVTLAKKYQKPIYAIGVGEKIEDLQEFDASNYARNLVGLIN